MSTKRLNFDFHLYFYSDALMLVCMLKNCSCALLKRLNCHLPSRTTISPSEVGAGVGGYNVAQVDFAITQLSMLLWFHKFYCTEHGGTGGRLMRVVYMNARAEKKS